MKPRSRELQASLHAASAAPLRTAVTALLALASVACTESAQTATSQLPVPEADTDSVVVVFTRDEQPVRVYRAVPQGTAGVRTALELLVCGPSQEERSAGIGSWFSERTSGVVQEVSIDSVGNVIIDFSDLRPLIPNASTSAGSAMLLRELNGTVFQFPDIQTVVYRIDGSCPVFWEWLQYRCREITRG